MTFETPCTILMSEFTLLIISSMDQSLCWIANRFSATQEIPRILWNSKIHYQIHKCTPSFPIRASSIQSILPHPTSWRSVLILPSDLRHDQWVAVLDKAETDVKWVMEWEKVAELWLTIHDLVVIGKLKDSTRMFNVYNNCGWMYEWRMSSCVL